MTSQSPAALGWSSVSFAALRAARTAMRTVRRVRNSRSWPLSGPMRTRQKRFALMIACGSMALVATISATLAADKSRPQIAPPRGSAPAAAQAPPRELVTTYCVTCHNERLKTANLMLDRVDADDVSNSAEEWEKVIVKLRSRAMPPPGVRRPDNATYDSVATWLATEL